MLALTGCGGRSARRDAGHTFCQRLQKAGALLEPMSQCLREYEQATREPTITTEQRPSHFFDNQP